MREWESGRVGEWESGRVGEWESGRGGEWEKGNTGSPILPFSHSPTLPFSHSPILPFLLLLVVAALLNVHCGGYHLANRADAIPSHIRSIGIPAFKNLTQRYEIEQRLTQALIQEFVAKSRYSVSSTDKGVDAVLRGEVTNMGAVPVIFGRETFGSVFLVFISCRVSLLSLKDNKILYQNNDLIFRDQYVLNSDVAQFFSEENSAIDRIAKDFASSLVTSIMESF